MGPMLEFETEGHADRVTAVFPAMEGGRKVRAPLGRVLGNAQASGGGGNAPSGDGKWHRNIPSFQRWKDKGEIGR